MPEVKGNYSARQLDAMEIGVSVRHFSDETSIVADQAGYTILNGIPAFTQERMRTEDVDKYLHYHMERTKNGSAPDQLSPLQEPVQFLDFKIPE